MYHGEDIEDESGSETDNSPTSPTLRSKILQSLLDEDAEYDEEQIEYESEPVATPPDVAPSRPLSPAPCDGLPMQTQTSSPAVLIPAVPPPLKTAANLGFDDVIDLDDDVFGLDNDIMDVDDDEIEV